MEYSKRYNFSSDENSKSNDFRKNNSQKRKRFEKPKFNKNNETDFDSELKFSENTEKQNRAKLFAKREKSSKIEKNEKKPLGRGTHRHAERKKNVFSRKEMFDANSIPYESKKILETFDDIVAEVRGLSMKQRVFLANDIKKLSHQLTDDRNSRRLGYMNSAENVTAYIAYFMWWNLVRLTRLFANLPKKAFDLQNNSVAIDIGSGPLTVVTALWLSRPELRNKKITWYCVDLSQNALSQGEEIYLSIVAKTIALTKKEGVNSAIEPWKIIRVKGELGTEIKEKANLVTCANAFNEIIQNNEMPTDFLAKKYSGEIEKYVVSTGSTTENIDSTKTVLLVEPGDPHSARFISLMRDAFIRRDFIPLSPCQHANECPMAGRTGTKKNAKWCNFGFETEDAPIRLLKLSEKANLPKERAVLSFILSQKLSKEEKAKIEERELNKIGEIQKNPRLRLRIASNFIKLPELHKSGYYACSEIGMLLAVDTTNVKPKNGESLEVPFPEGKLEKDAKSGATIINI